MTSNNSIDTLIEEAKVEFAKKGQVYRLPKHLEKKCISYQGMFIDSFLLLEILTELKTQKYKASIMAALWRSFISIYGKFFTDSTKNRFPKLEANEVFSQQNSELLVFHNEIMHLRHNLVAHRGSTEWETIFPFYLPGNVPEGNKLQIKWITRNFPDKSRILEYIKLINHLRCATEAKLSSMIEKADRYFNDPKNMSSIIKLRL